MTKQTKQLRIGGVPEHFNFPWHLALKDKSFEGVGLDVTWQDFLGGTGEMNDALRHQDIDVAIMLTEGIVKDIVEGNPSKIIQEYIASPLIWGIHVAKESSYKTIGDLEDTTCAISRYGSGSHLLAYVNAQNEGWNTETLDFEVVQDLEGALEALPKDTAQYFMWEHFTTKPYVDQGVFRRVGDCPTPWPCFVIVAREDVIETRESDLKKLLGVINSKTQNFKSIPGLSKTLATTYAQQDVDIEAWLDVTEWSQKQISKTAIDKVQDKLKKLSLIDNAQSFDQICHAFT